MTASGAGPDGHETFRLPLPAVVTVLEGGVEPRYPTVPGRMKAKKAPIEERAADRRARRPVPACASCSRRRRRRPSQVLGEGPAAAPAVVDLFEQLGVLAR